MHHVIEYAPAKPKEYSSDFPQFSKLRVLQKKYLKDDEHSSLYLVRKYARIFVSICPWTLSVPQSSQFFPRATLSKNCSLLGTDNVRGQTSKHIFTPVEAIFYIYIHLLPVNLPFVSGKKLPLQTFQLCSVR